jgi:hypothetical protein
MNSASGRALALGVAWAASAAGSLAADAPPPGIYVEQASGEPQAERLATSRPTRTGAKDIGKTIIKGMLTGGMLGGAPKLVMAFSGAQAPVRLAAQPMFQFRFDPNGSAAPAAGSADMAAALAMMSQMQSGEAPADMPPGIDRPQQFALVRLESKGEERLMEASSDMKPTRKYAVACHVRQLGPHVFRVAPEKPLPPGEYGFVAAGGSGGVDRLWSFGVDASSVATDR